MADYLVQEDGASRISLGDVPGFILLAPSTDTSAVGGRVLRPRKRHRGDLKAAYEQLVAVYQPAAAAEVLPVAVIVRPFAAPSDTALPPVAAVDFAAIERSAETSRRLAAALDELVTAATARAEAAADDEDMEDLLAVMQAIHE